MSTPYETLTLQVEAHIATLTLNRPDSRNALNMQMCKELTAACDWLASESDVRAVIVRGAGPAFCAGADLKERQHMSQEEMVARRVAGFTVYGALEALPMPVIAMVQGPAFGSGAEIAGACDFVLGDERAAFRYPEVGWGTVGATQRLPRIVGRRMAKELLFTGRTVGAEEARELGLLNHVYPAGDLEREATAMAQAIARCNPLTVRLTKSSIDEGLETTRRGAMAIELLAIQENLRHSDWKAAIANFGQKSLPRGTGHGA